MRYATYRSRSVSFGVALACVAAAGLSVAACSSSQEAGEVLDEEYGEEAASSSTIVLRGTVATMDESLGAAEVIENGAVVVRSGKIDRILKAGEALPTGKSVKVLPATAGESDWVITPGLINAHNHLAYNTARIYKELPLYENTYQWRDEKYYSTHIQYPKKILAECTAPVAELGAAVSGSRTTVDYDGLAGRYAEVKELVSGTTATQGSYFGTSVPSGYGQHLVRNLDSTNFGAKRVSQSSLGILVDSFDPRDVVKKMDAKSIDAWLVHLLEGTDRASELEFDCLRAMGLVRKETVIIHGTALTKAQLEEMGRVGAKLVISPLDNLLYYGKTPDVATAWKAGVTVSVGTDWSPAGSKNLLAELKVLDLLNQQVYGKVLTDRDMIKMVTTNPADTIGWTPYAGRIKAGFAADLAVYTKRKSASVYRSVIDATEKDVRLVLVGGDPLYGDVDAMKKLKPTDHEVIEGCGFQKAVDVTKKSTKIANGDVGYATMVSALSEALKFDPAWMLEHYSKASEWNESNVASNLKKAFPLGLAARTIDPLFVCQDRDFLEEVRTDANIRTAYNGVCLDLRPWYDGTAKPDCGSMPAKPKTLMTHDHPGNVPTRPAAWCSDQNWLADGELPKFRKDATTVCAAGCARLYKCGECATMGGGCISEKECVDSCVADGGESYAMALCDAMTACDELYKCAGAEPPTVPVTSAERTKCEAGCKQLYACGQCASTGDGCVSQNECVDLCVADSGASTGLAECYAKSTCSTIASCQ